MLCSIKEKVHILRVLDAWAYRNPNVPIKTNVKELKYNVTWGNLPNTPTGLRSVIINHNIKLAHIHM